MALVDDRFKGDVSKLLMDLQKGAKPLPNAPEVSPIPEKVGFSAPKPRDVPSTRGIGSGGVASPVTETTWEVREYFPEETVFSSDGIFSFTVKRVKQITMLDSNGSQVLLIFKAPVVE